MNKSQYMGQWVAAEQAHGATRAELLVSLQQLGWHPRSAEWAIDEATADGAPAANAPVPFPQIQGGKTAVALGDRTVRLLMHTRRPQALLLGDFLSRAECEALIALAEPEMRRSGVFTPDVETNAAGATSYARTSDQASLAQGRSELVDRIYQRASHLTDWPCEDIEAMQLVRYRPGAEFSPHYDYFHPNTESGALEIARHGQRVATLILYLMTPQRGGATLFLDADLEILPVQGNALLFAYGNAHDDSQTLHAGVPVSEGEKWIATLFFRRRPVRLPEGQA